MNDELFLKRFENHVLFFLTKKLLTKKEMLKNLTVQTCPFRLSKFDGKYGSYFLGIKKRHVVAYYYADASYRENMRYQWFPTLVPKMKEIICKIKID